MDQTTRVPKNRLRWFSLMLVFGALALIPWLNIKASPGYSLQFNGAGNYVDLGDTGELWVNPSWLTQKTISLWIKPSELPGPVAPVGSGQLIIGTDKPRLFGITRSISNNQDRLWV